MQLAITTGNTPGLERQSGTKRSATGYAVVKTNAEAAFIAVETVHNATGATVYSRGRCGRPTIVFRNNIGLSSCTGCVSRNEPIPRERERDRPLLCKFPGLKTRRCWLEHVEMRSGIPQLCFALDRNVLVDKNLRHRRLKIAFGSALIHSRKKRWTRTLHASFSDRRQHKNKEETVIFISSRRIFCVL